jgi:hypothetical protein
MARPVLANASERVAPPAMTAEERLETGLATFGKIATETMATLTRMKLDISSMV